MLQQRVDRLEGDVKEGRHKTSVQIIRNLVSIPVRWGCITILGIVLIDKLDRKEQSGNKAA